MVANAEAIKSRLAQESILTTDRILVIQNGPDLSRFPISRRGFQKSSGLGSHSAVFAVVANLRPEKGHLTFIRAAQCIGLLGSTVRFDRGWAHASEDPGIHWEH